jgi:hypothetical protein
MRTIEQEVYNFSELSKDVQEKIIEKYYENEEYPFLTDDLMENLSELDTLKIFSNVQLQYSLSYTQGDGLSFSTDIDILKWLKNRNMKTSVLDVIYNNIYSIKCTGNMGQYYYANGKDITLEVQDNSGKHKRIDKLMDIIKEELSDYYISICHKLTKIGYSIVDYRMSIEEFSEYSNDNGYEYFINGRQF